MNKSESLDKAYERKMQYVEALRKRPIAIETDSANQQHYEVGTGVLQSCLGPRMKYSCCLYPQGEETLGQAEVLMLQTYVQKADLRDGQSILDLGYERLHPIARPFADIFQLWMGISLIISGRAIPKFQSDSVLQFTNAACFH